MSDDTKDDAGNGGDGADDALAKVTANNEKLLKELKEAREQARALKAQEDERKAKEAEAEEAIARQKGEWDKIEGGYKAKLQEHQGEGLLWRSRYENLVIDRGLDTALDAARISPALKKAATALIRAEHAIDLDDSGGATVDGKPLADFVSAWAQSDSGKAFVPNGNSGGGAGGSGGGSGGGGGSGNPWEPGKVNLTRQGEIFRKNPEQARQMAAQHGVRL
jgi:hypothetical protein